MSSIDDLVEKKRALKRKAEESSILPVQTNVSNTIGQQSQQSNQSSQPGSSSSATGQPSAGSQPVQAAGTPASNPAGSQPSATPALSPTPHHAFTMEQLGVLTSFSKANLLAVAQKLPIKNLDAKSNAKQLNSHLHWLYGWFTNLNIDPSNETIEFDAFEEQLFQQPTAGSLKQSAA